MSASVPMCNQISDKAVGVYCLVCSPVLMYIGIIMPIWNAAQHKPIVYLWMKVAIIAPLVLALGIAYTFFGDKATKLLGVRNRPSKRGWVFYIFFVITGIVVYVWVRKMVEGYGYSINGI